MSCQPRRVDGANDVHVRDRPAKKQELALALDGSRDVLWEMLPWEHSGSIKGLVPVLVWTCVPRCKVHIVPALPAFFHRGGLSPHQPVRPGRGHQVLHSHQNHLRWSVRA